MSERDPLLDLLSRFDEEGVEYVLVGGQAVVDLLFTANGQTYESVQPWVRQLEVEGTPVKVLDIDGLIRTKTDYREKDLLDKRALLRIKEQMRR